MGNLCALLKQKPLPSTHNSKKLRSSNGAASSSNRWSRTRSSRKDKFDDASIREQAIAAAILFKQHQQHLQNGGGAFDRSSSLRYSNGSSKKNALPRSSSSRARSLTDPLLQPHQLVNQVCSYKTRGGKKVLF
ncbi:hypothetical protein PIB30_102416, partial [Stylosanthes scabra]|nr:hypothetical protein [Stylosanthes scabra]